MYFLKSKIYAPSFNLYKRAGEPLSLWRAGSDGQLSVKVGIRLVIESVENEYFPPRMKIKNGQK
jgi:uncharacterized UPF0146 family protein